MKFTHRIFSVLFGALLVLGLAVPSLAQQSEAIGSAPGPKIAAPKGAIHISFDADAAAPAMSVKPRGGGSFGGGGRSFGGGGRSFGGGGGSSTGSFGGGSRSFGGSSSSPRTSSSSGTSSFGRSGAMGSSGPTRSTSIGGSSYAPRGTTSFYYGGHPYYGYGYGGWGGYSYGWMHPAWYMYTPFYPSFYYDRPYMDNMGYYHAGGFSFIHALGGLCCCPLIFIGIIWMLSKSFGSGKRIKYTSSN